MQAVTYDERFNFGASTATPASGCKSCLSPPFWQVIAVIHRVSRRVCGSELCVCVQLHSVRQFREQ